MGATSLPHQSSPPLTPQDAACAGSAATNAPADTAAIMATPAATRLIGTPIFANSSPFGSDANCAGRRRPGVPATLQGAALPTGVGPAAHSCRSKGTSPGKWARRWHFHFRPAEKGRADARVDPVDDRGLRETRPAVREDR